MHHDHEFDDLNDGHTSDNGDAGGHGLLGLVAAAAVGAGVALLFSTDRGRSLRRTAAERVREMDLEERAADISALAAEGVRYVRHRGKPRRSRTGLYATLGTVAGAAVAAALAPDSTRKAKDWVGDAFEDVRHSASVRWREHRAARQDRMTPNTAEAIRRLEDTVEESDEAPLARPAGASRNPGAPVSPRDGGASPA